MKNVNDHLQDESENGKTTPDNKADENLPDIKLLDKRMASLPNEMSIGYTEHQP